MAPATKYGGNTVACHPGSSDTAKSKLTTVCTESTSGVERPASSSEAISYRCQCLADPRQPEREDPVDALHPDVLRPIAHRRQVGNQADVPEQHRDGRVGRHREHVPDERALEVGPQVHRVRVREQPVRRQPRPAGVEDREDRRAHHREDRHRLGEAADRHAPLLPEQQQDRRDQRPGMADADPPDEVDDVKAPADGDVDAPQPDALEQNEGEGEQEHLHHAEGDQEPEQPPGLESRTQDGARDLRRDRPEGMPGSDDVVFALGPCPGEPSDVPRPFATSLGASCCCSR